MLEALKRLFASRKFLLALGGIGADVLVLLTIEPALATKLAVLITTLIGVVIGGIAIEDAAEKRAGGIEDE